MQPGVGRGRARLRSPLRAGDPTGEEAPGRAASPWRGWALPVPRRLLLAEGASSAGLPALPQLPRSHQRAGARPRWGRESPACRGCGGCELSEPRGGLPVLTRPCRPPRGRSCSRRYLPEGGITVRRIPAPPAEAPPPSPPPGLYLGLRRASLGVGGAGCRGFRPALASRALLAWVFKEQI